MSIKVIMTLAALAAPGLAIAQAEPSPVKSADEIVCDLTLDCENALDAKRDVGRSRGFVISRRTTADAPAASKPSAYSPPAKRMIAKPTGRQPERSTGRMTRDRGARDRAVGGAPAAPRTSNLAVGFVTGSAELDGAGLRQASELLQALKLKSALAGKRIVVSGHTDSVGDRAYNLDLSQRRAAALVDYLVQNGIDRARLQAKGFGFDKPLPGMSARDGANRRVEIALAE